MTPWMRLAVVGVMATVLVAGCGTPQGSAPPRERSTEAPTPSAPKRIVAAMLSDVPTISSTLVAASSGTIQGGDTLEDLVHAGLAVIDNEGRLLPQLAEAVPSLENGQWRPLPDGRMQTTWSIRP